MLWLADALIGTQTLKRSNIDYKTYVERAHRQRAQVVRAALGSLFETTRKMPTAVRSLNVRYGNWRNRRMAVRQLSTLSDHILRDIGLTRGDIRTLALAHSDRSHGRPETRQVGRLTDQPDTREAAPVTQSGSPLDWRRAA